MMIDVSIATFYSEVYFDYFLYFFSRFFLVFSPSFARRRYIFTFFCLFSLSMFPRTKSYIFGDIIVSCMTAGLGFKMAASNSKWQVCDVILTSRHVIIGTSSAQSVKLMTCYKRAIFHRKSFNTFRDLSGSETPKKPRQNRDNFHLLESSFIKTKEMFSFTRVTTD